MLSESILSANSATNILGMSLNIYKLIYFFLFANAVIQNISASWEFYSDDVWIKTVHHFILIGVWQVESSHHNASNVLGDVQLVFLDFWVLIGPIYFSFYVITAMNQSYTTASLQVVLDNAFNYNDDVFCLIYVSL